MRTSTRTKKIFYVALTVSFVLSLYYNGTFNAFGPADDVYSIHEVPRQSNDIRLPPKSKKDCAPQKKIVFLKTHKTASSTAAAIIERYGYDRNLTFAVSNVGLKFYYVPLFNRAMVKESHVPVSGWKKEDGYSMLTNHARYNRVEMDAVVHNAVYVTIIRHPVDQLESAFGYFALGETMGLDRGTQLDKFMKDPQRLFGSVKKGYWQFAKNNQLFDLGLDHKYHDDMTGVRETVLRLDREFDLVMIKEYFDESLILLRQLLCWDMEDILYISNAIRSERRRLGMNEDLKRRIREWNKADMELYRQCNETFWRKVEDYGPQFYQDLDEFRTRLRVVAEECIDTSKKDRRDPREDKFVLKSTAQEYCKGLLMGDVEYTRFIQRRMWDLGILLPYPKHRR